MPSNALSTRNGNGRRPVAPSSSYQAAKQRLASLNLGAERELTQLPTPATFPALDRRALTKRQNQIVEKAEEDVLAEGLTVVKGAFAVQGAGYMANYADATNQVTIARMGRRLQVNRKLCPNEDMQAVMTVAGVEGAARLADANNRILDATNAALIKIVERELSLGEKMTLLQQLQLLFGKK